MAAIDQAIKQQLRDDLAHLQRMVRNHERMDKLGIKLHDHVWDSDDQEDCYWNFRNELPRLVTALRTVLGE